MINFHTEQPADEDLFPGGSHEKVAAAMQAYITTPNSSQVIGLDGEFGSGKSSILAMLGAKLTAADDKYRVWFFDCEQNYQGSIKSNFIELFTEEVLKDVRPGSKEAVALIQSRDVALGREFEYSKKTTSRVSAWALALLASLFFSSSSFKEIFKLATPPAGVSGGLMTANWIAFVSPVLVLFLAWLFNRKKAVGTNKNWSLLSLFKGSSEDYINEKIETSKEVTPLDLKRTLTFQLQQVPGQRYVVILDNLDRLPKDSLRSVWSDLEIFTSVASVENLTVVVPFCSTKVAAYLGSDSDRKYDSRDFIAKKFPVVFRAPPVITSGWKDGFRRMWNHTFPNADSGVAEQCAQLLHRHSPMASGLVTPRLQKKFINDIATTSLVVGEEINLICIAAHLLLCRYNELPLEEILRRDGISEAYRNDAKLDDADVAKLVRTKSSLSSACGEGMESGWQIQMLQIHFLTTSKIAIAELIDEPLLNAIEAADGDKLFSLTSLFGFGDAFKRLLATNPPLSALLPVIHSAFDKHGGEWAREAMELVNGERLPVLPDNTRGSPEFYESLRRSIEIGLDPQLLTSHGAQLKTSIESSIEGEFSDKEFTLLKTALIEYDQFLGAVDEEFEGMTVDHAEYVMHLLSTIQNMRVIKLHDFALSDEGLPSANQQLVSTEGYSLAMSPLERSQVVQALHWAYSSRGLTAGLVGGIDANDTLAISTLCEAGEEEAAVICLALAETIDSTVINTVANLLSGNANLTVKAVAAIVYVRRKDPALLASIPDLETIVSSDLFRSLGNAVLQASQILPLLLTDVRDTMAPYVAHLIKERSINRLQVSWMLGNFSVVVSAVEPHGVSKEDVLEWFEGWDARTEADAKKPSVIDVAFLTLVFASEGKRFPIFKRSSFAFVDVVERTEEEWRQVITQALPQVTAIVTATAEQGRPIAGASTVANAIVSALHDYTHDEESFELNDATLAILNALIQALDPQLRHVIGARLRSLFYSDPKHIERLTWVIERFGTLIQDVQPTNADEATRLIRLLDSIGRNPAGTGKAALFMDSKADQLGAYRYSKDLREAMVSVVAKLEERAPRLYKKFASKRWFTSIFKPKPSVIEETVEEAQVTLPDNSGTSAP
ncbi:P-loop NTPase fold protein [Pseudomonas jessenii]|uniref:P-loop NTPase fold protein n=1 Tax=Pseudomonas jessenii TaxID=77298 RepID=UPI003892376C